jgi:Cu/Ag efflux pump CusA
VIKPEDITESTRREIVRAINNADRDFESEVAAIANVLIEAGVVSPPCYCLRWNGELQTHGTACPNTVLLRPRLFAGKPWADDQEHYMGQTE